MSKKVSSVTIQVTQPSGGDGSVGALSGESTPADILTTEPEGTTAPPRLNAGEEGPGQVDRPSNLAPPPYAVETPSKDSAKSCPKCGHLWKAASSEPWPPCDDARHTQTETYPPIPVSEKDVWERRALVAEGEWTKWRERAEKAEAALQSPTVTSVVEENEPCDCPVENIPTEWCPKCGGDRTARIAELESQASTDCPQCKVWQDRESHTPPSFSQRRCPQWAEQNTEQMRRALRSARHFIGDPKFRNDQAEALKTINEINDALAAASPAVNKDIWKEAWEHAQTRAKLMPPLLVTATTLDELARSYLAGHQAGSLSARTRPERKLTE